MLRDDFVCDVLLTDAAGAPAWELLFLECDPRFSGGIASAIASGLDLPYTLSRLPRATPSAPATFISLPAFTQGRVWIRLDFPFKLKDR